MQWSAAAMQRGVGIRREHPISLVIRNMSTSSSQAAPRANRARVGTAPSTHSHPPTFDEQRVAAPRTTLDKALTHPDRIQTQQQNDPQSPPKKGPSWAGIVSKNLPAKKRQPIQPPQAHKPPMATTRYEQSPHRYHVPKTGLEEDHVYVLTLRTTPSIAQPMNALRKEYFPQHLNRTPAHLTLFHALPHSRIDVLQETLAAIARCTKPFSVSTGTPFRMGKGVGIGLGEGAKEARNLHDALRTAWLEFLSDQDQGGWRPHWTVMNKVGDEERVRDAFTTIRTDLGEKTLRGRVVGMDLWRYERGRWEWAQDFKFVGDGRVDVAEA